MKILRDNRQMNEAQQLQFNAEENLLEAAEDWDIALTSHRTKPLHIQ